MEQYLTRTFDKLTVEEIKLICPKSMSFELSPETFQRIHSKVLDQLRGVKNEPTERRIDVKPTNSPVSTGSKTHKKSRVFKVLIIAAIICALIAVSAMAYYLGGGRFLANLFGEKSFSIIDEYVMSDVSHASDEHLCLTLESALTDGHYYYVVFSVSRMDGGNIVGLTPDAELKFTYATPSRIKPAYQIERFDTDESTDSCVYYIALIRSDNDISSMNMSLSRMYASDGSTAEISTDLTVEADFISCPLATGGAADSVFRNIELSPFCLWIDVYEAWENDDSLSDGLPIYDIYIKFADGNTVGATAEQFSDFEYLESIGWGGIQYPNGTNQSYISISFAEFIDIGKVDAAIIDGIEYPVSVSE